MAGFEDLNGIPATANQRLLTGILRREWHFDGLLVSDYDAVHELIAHGIAANDQQAALKALTAGVDMDMADGTYQSLLALVDVVYNHFGPEGNYLGSYAPQFFTDRHCTPWGDAINFDGSESRVVRDFFIHNALYWLTEYHFDGLRLDAVHAIIDESTPDILTEIAETVRRVIGPDRLTSEAITADPGGNNGTVSYTYDAVGNRTQVTSTLNAVPGGSLLYDANDRLTTDNWDANGNTISSGGISYSYDFENRLLMRGSVLIIYDGDGNRVSETGGGVTTEYLVETLNPTGLPQVLDEVVNGSVVRTYTYGLQRASGNQLISGTWTPSFYGYDGHENVRLLANTNGAITDTYQFDAFGNQIATSGHAEQLLVRRRAVTTPVHT